MADEASNPGDPVEIPNQMWAGGPVHLTGASGFLGGVVLGRAERIGTSVIRLGRRPEDEVPLDLADSRSVERFARIAEAAATTAVCVHCGAMAAVGACAADPDLAWQVNVNATARLAQAFGSRMVFVSTDLVFAGDDAPYGVLDEPNPRSEYGRTKVAAEAKVLEAGGTVLRIPLLFGRDSLGRGASEMVLDALRNDRDVTLFTNEHRTPLHVQDAADALLEEAAQCTDPSRATVAAGARLKHRPGPTRLTRAAFGHSLATTHGVSVAHLRERTTDAEDRPRDVSLTTEDGWTPARGWDAMLRDA